MRTPWAEEPPEDWIGRQVKAAEERGAFDDLPGKGKPLQGLDKPWSVDRWLTEWAEREGLGLLPALPESLQLRKEREGLSALIVSRSSEQAVRAVVDDFNARLREAYRRPQQGPPLTVRGVDVEEAVAQWHAARAASPADGPGAAGGTAGADRTHPPHGRSRGRSWKQWLIGRFTRAEPVDGGRRP
ncbi:DnaJ family domain-containing protein [Motilibacter aurantiacus]|uniref:DnaJ family domain-containing protein n=1 Tax=Motilibacter aurantiacus TaxID=2714955 RepID=UPI00140B230E|nr:DUF1992 domain-containing protein [Motilibacter aurantiacus]